MPQRRRRRQVAVSLALALGPSTLVLGSAPVDAAMTSSRVMQFSATAGSWSATSTRVDATMLASPTPLSIMGATALFGVSAEGHLIESSPDPQGTGQWVTSDLTASTNGPTLRGAVAVLVDRANRVEILGRTSIDHLVAVRSSADPSGWSVTDLTESSKAPLIASNPSAVIGAHGGINVFYRSSSSHLIGLLERRRLSTRWWVRDLTKTTGGPDVRGTPSAVATPVDGATVSVAVRASSGDLLVVADDNARLTVWSSYDLSTVPGSGPLSSSPTAVRAFGRLAVTGVGPDGSLLLISAPKAASHRYVAVNLTARSQSALIEADSPSMRVDGDHLLITGRSTDRHLLVYQADSTSAFRSVVVTDVSAQGQGIEITSAPVLAEQTGAPAVYAARYLPPPPPPPPPPSLTTQIVAIAKGQDQRAAAVGETPAGSNCNPYTAHFGRGQSAGCVAGTSAEAWCSDFANWVWQAAGAQIGGLTGWSYTFADYGRAHGTWKLGATNDPQPGDAVIFGDESQHYGSHVGIVVAVRGSMIKMTSGNWGDAVITTDFFDPAGPSGAGFPIIGYSSPVAVGAARPHAASAHSGGAPTQGQINSQDQGR